MIDGRRQRSRRAFLAGAAGAGNSWGGEAFVAQLRAFTGDCYSKDGKKATMDTPEVLEAMQWHENLMQRERIMHPIANASVSFVDGKVAMIGRTYFNFKSVELLPKVGDRFKWDGVMMPKHPKTGKRGGMFAGDAPDHRWHEQGRGELLEGLEQPAATDH